MAYTAVYTLYILYIQGQATKQELFQHVLKSRMSMRTERFLDLFHVTAVAPLRLLHIVHITLQLVASTGPMPLEFHCIDC